MSNYLNGKIQGISSDVASVFISVHPPPWVTTSIIGDATLAGTIMDRLVHNAYKINLRGESMRKKQAKLTDTEHTELK